MTVRLRMLQPWRPETAISPDWIYQSVDVWAEDECLRHDPDAEHLCDAWKRLTGNDYKSPFDLRRESGEAHDARPEIPVDTNHVYDDNDPAAKEWVATFNGEDAIYHLHRSGWVAGSSYCGGFVGVAAEVMDLPPPPRAAMERA